MEQSEIEQLAREHYPHHFDYQQVWVNAFTKALELFADKEFSVADLNMAINLARHINHTVWELPQNAIIERLIELKTNNNDNSRTP